jgi:hypothetical protein
VRRLTQRLLGHLASNMTRLAGVIESLAPPEEPSAAQPPMPEGGPPAHWVGLLRARAPHLLDQGFFERGGLPNASVRLSSMKTSPASPAQAEPPASAPGPDILPGSVDQQSALASGSPAQRVDPNQHTHPHAWTQPGQRIGRDMATRARETPQRVRSFTPEAESNKPVAASQSNPREPETSPKSGNMPELKNRPDPINAPDSDNGTTTGPQSGALMIPEAVGKVGTPRLEHDSPGSQQASPRGSVRDLTPLLTTKPSVPEGEPSEPINRPRDLRELDGSTPVIPPTVFPSDPSTDSQSTMEPDNYGFAVTTNGTPEPPSFSFSEGQWPSLPDRPAPIATDVRLIDARHLTRLHAEQEGHPWSV